MEDHVTRKLLKTKQAWTSPATRVVMRPPQTSEPLEDTFSKIIKLGITPTKEICFEDLMAWQKVWYRHYQLSFLFLSL